MGEQGGVGGVPGPVGLPGHADGRDAATAAAIRAIIEDGRTPAQARVLALVETLDLAVLAERQADRHHGPAAQLLARAVVAIGGPLLAADPAPPAAVIRAVGATRAAAAAYADAPGDDTELAYFTCATGSYPYGPGDGCLATGDTCEPGSGCWSGAGTLACAGATIGFDAVIEALAAELAPWLRASAAAPDRGPGG